MKILLYNWAAVGTGQVRGGGVGIYLANLAIALVRLGHAVTILSAGDRYKPVWPRIYLAKRHADNGVVHYDIVNSSVIAPSFFMFDRIETVLEAAGLRAMLHRFLKNHGPFDIVHFHNLEGISYDCLTLSKEFPASKFIFTNHNYNLICQQVNLWFQDRERCTDYDQGRKCTICNVFEVDTDAEVTERYLKLELPGNRSWKTRERHRRWSRRAMRLWRLLGPLPWDKPAHRAGDRAELFRTRRRRAIDLINANCARILSASKATESILLRQGLAEDKSTVCYIGTNHYRPYRPRKPRGRSATLSLGFLGYTRPDKGFHFLIKALEAMPKHLEGQFSLLVAAIVTDTAVMERLQACASKLQKLEVVNGYSHDELPNLLADVDVGLVLPLWDDTLPQVAIEFVCYGVPILVSDRGGQAELANDPSFVVAGESVEDFWRKLSALAGDRSALERFWMSSRILKTNDEHAQEIASIYAQAAGSSQTEAR